VQPQTVRELLKCERGKGDDACPNQVGGWLAIENFANGPFCSGIPPKRFNELSKTEIEALVPTIVQWFHAHPQTLGMDVDDGIVKALKTLYPCQR